MVGCSDASARDAAVAWTAFRSGRWSAGRAQPQRNRPARQKRLRALAWLPIAVLLLAVVALSLLEPGGGREDPRVVTGATFAFVTLASIFVADVVARAFAARGAPGLVLLGCGAVLWATSGVVTATVTVSQPDHFTTIHSLCSWLAAACHLGGAILSLRPRRTVGAAGVWVPTAYLASLAVVALVTVSARENWTPTFFVPGAGFTPVRQAVVGSASLMFVAAGVLTGRSWRRTGSGFCAWYAPALLLIATGLLALLLQPSHGTWLSWTGRTAQYLGGVYMAVAAVAALRESRAWGASVEQALHASERQYEALFRSSMDAILLSDAAGDLIAANPAACALFGRSEADLCRLGRAGLLARGADLEPVLRRRDTSGSVRAEVELVRADGSRFAAELSSVVLDRDGRAFDIVRDVTDRKRAVEALREADRRKDRFLATLSHELRNPLTPIRNGIQILERVSPGSESARRAQEVVSRQVDQLAHIVDDLLDVTRIKRNLVRLRREPVDLCALARKAVEDHRELFQARGVRLGVAASEPVSVDGDARRLNQVLENLLQNAAKFTRRGGRTSVAVSADAAGGQAVLRVTDDGAGMSPEMLARLFQPFTQADETLDRNEGGLGLGLALVKGLVELHGGTIGARSAGVGAGAEFEVRLPLSEGAMLAAASAPAAAHVGRRILVIEDNADAAETLRQVLELQGHSVVAVAGNGPDGLERARTARPEVVLCDIGLPFMDGYQVARAFRSDAALAATHLFALSGYAQPEDLRRAAEAGFDGHMAKPPDLAQLEQLLARLPRR